MRPKSNSWSVAKPQYKVSKILRDVGVLPKAAQAAGAIANATSEKVCVGDDGIQRQMNRDIRE
jgi:hypothetical protein